MEPERLGRISGPAVEAAVTSAALRGQPEAVAVAAEGLLLAAMSEIYQEMPQVAFPDPGQSNLRLLDRGHTEASRAAAALVSGAVAAEQVRPMQLVLKAAIRAAALCTAAEEEAEEEGCQPEPRGGLAAPEEPAVLIPAVAEVRQARPGQPGRVEQQPER